MNLVVALMELSIVLMNTISRMLFGTSILGNSMAPEFTVHAWWTFCTLFYWGFVGFDPLKQSLKEFIDFCERQEESEGFEDKASGYFG